MLSQIIEFDTDFGILLRRSCQYIFTVRSSLQNSSYSLQSFFENQNNTEF